jgi:uncharacterized DUF497 family protein
MEFEWDENKNRANMARQASASYERRGFLSRMSWSLSMTAVIMERPESVRLLL